MLGEPLQTPPGSESSTMTAIPRGLPGTGAPSLGPLPGHRPVLFEDFLTTRDVAERLGVGRQTVFLKIKEGRFHPVKKLVKKRRILVFNPDEVEAEIARLHELVMTRPGRYATPRTAHSKTPRNKESLPEPQPARAQEPQPIHAQEPAPQKTDSPRENSKSQSDPINGEVCARAVTLFLAGKQQLDVIVEMKIDFKAAKYLWDSYLQALPCWAIPTKNLSRIRNLINWTEDPPTLEGLEKALVAHVARQLDSPSRPVKSDGIEMSEEDRAGLAELEKEIAAKAALVTATAKPQEK